MKTELTRKENWRSHPTARLYKDANHKKQIFCPCCEGEIFHTGFSLGWWICAGCTRELWESDRHE